MDAEQFVQLIDKRGLRDKNGGPIGKLVSNNFVPNMTEKWDQTKNIKLKYESGDLNINMGIGIGQAFLNDKNFAKYRIKYNSDDKGNTTDFYKVIKAWYRECKDSIKSKEESIMNNVLLSEKIVTISILDITYPKCTTIFLSGNDLKKEVNLFGKKYGTNGLLIMENTKRMDFEKFLVNDRNNKSSKKKSK